MNWSVLCNRSDRRTTDGTVEWSGRPLWAASARRPKIGTSSFNPEPAATGYGANASLTEATTCGVFLRCMRSKDGTEEAVTLVACPGTVARRRWLRVKRKGGELADRGAPSIIGPFPKNGRPKNAPRRFK